MKLTLNIPDGLYEVAKNSSERYGTTTTAELNNAIKLGQFLIKEYRAGGKILVETNQAEYKNIKIEPIALD